MTCVQHERKRREFYVGALHRDATTPSFGFIEALSLPLYLVEREPVPLFFFFFYRVWSLSRVRSRLNNCI